MDIQFSGLATGIDSSALIDALVQSQRIPVIRLENRQAVLQSKLSSFSDLLGRMNDLETAAADLKDQTGINATSTSVSEEDYFTASSDGRAAPGVFSVGVKQLAQREKEISQGFADLDTTVVQTGQMTLTVDGEDTVIDVTDGTLGGIKDAIAASGAEVDVTLLDDGSANPFRLVITAKESGKAVSLDNTFSTALNLTEQQTGQPAIVVIDGIEITRDSNLISDAIEGVTLSLKDADGANDPPTTRELTVEVDSDGIKANIQEFVDKYNRVISFLDDQTAFDETAGRAGRLLGDFTASAVERRLQSVVSGAISGATGSFGSLGQVGIRTSANGTLAIDETDFAEAVDDDLQGVLSLFDEDEGNLMGTIEDFLKDATLSGTGLIPARQEAIQSQIDGFQDRIDFQERRLERFQESQVRKFAALERLVSGLQSQQLFLGAAF